MELSAFFGEAHAASASVQRMSFATHQTAAFEEQQHGPHRIGVRGSPCNQGLLRDLTLLRENVQQDKLIGRDAVPGEMGVGPAVHRQIRGPQCNGQGMSSFIHMPTLSHSHAVPLGPRPTIYYLYVLIQHNIYSPSRAWQEKILKIMGAVMRLLVAGGGIGGLVAGLCLHRAGIETVVFESAQELRPLGVASICCRTAFASTVSKRLLDGRSWRKLPRFTR